MRGPWIRGVLPLCLLSLFITACSGDAPSSISAPGDALDARITGVQLVLASGGAQVGVPGHALAEPVVIRVLDRRGAPVAGARVNFLPSAGGMADPRQTSTDSAGYARATWMLMAPGAHTLRASGVGGTVLVTATAQPGDGSTRALVKTAGDGQRAAAGARLPAFVEVRLLRDDGTAVGQAQVTWRVATGGGAVNRGTMPTSGTGYAKVRWTLGMQPGEQTLVASAPGADSVIFTARAPGDTPRGPATLHLSPDSLVLDAGQTGAFTAEVRDENGARLPGHTPSWSSSDPAVATVNAQGQVAGAAAGTAQVTATLGALSATATVRVRAGGPSLQIAPDSLVLDVGVAGRLFTVLRDASGNAVLADPVWSSSSDIVSVDAAGNVRPWAPGTVRITAQVGTLTATATVRVRPPRGPLTIPQIQKRVASYGGSIDPSTRDVELNWWIHVSQRNVTTVSMRIRSPLGRTIDCTNVDAENWFRDEFRCRLTIPRGAEPGTWRVDQVTVTQGTQTTTFTSADLDEMKTRGRSFDVLGGGADTQPPQIRMLWPHQGTRYPDVYWLEVGVVDHVSGVGSVRMMVRGPNGVTHTCTATQSYGAFAKVGGGACRLPLRVGSGTWDLVSVEVEDGAGNRATYTPQQIDQWRGMGEEPFLVYSFTP